MTLRAQQYLGIFSVLFLLSACETTPEPVKDAGSFLRAGESAYAAGKYEDAIEQWKKVRESYSSPELTTQAELKIADAHFDNESFIEAAAAYEDFRKLHPGHEKSEYALYRQGLSHYHQVTGIDTDQTPVKNAVVVLEAFLKQYPNSPYAADAQQKLVDCWAKQLEYENYVGKFYLKTGKYASAIKRLNEALEMYPRTHKLDETLFYLGQAYLKSGEKAKAKETFNRLATQFPESPLNAEVDQL